MPKILVTDTSRMATIKAAKAANEAAIATARKAIERAQETIATAETQVEYYGLMMSAKNAARRQVAQGFREQLDALQMDAYNRLGRDSSDYALVTRRVTSLAAGVETFAESTRKTQWTEARLRRLIADCATWAGKL